MGDISEYMPPKPQNFVSILASPTPNVKLSLIGL